MLRSSVLEVPKMSISRVSQVGQLDLVKRSVFKPQEHVVQQDGTTLDFPTEIIQLL